MTSVHDDVMDFGGTAILKASASCSKSPSKICVTSILHPSKLGAERIFIDSLHLPTAKVHGIYRTHLICIHDYMNWAKVWLVNPCIMAVSKLCSAIMQMMLKVNSRGSVESLYPTLSILEGHWFMLWIIEFLWY